MFTLTFWQLLVVLAAGGLLTLAGLIWISNRHSASVEYGSNGCLERALSLLLAMTGLSLMTWIVVASF